jgi:multiple sugar transport system permease protein
VIQRGGPGRAAALRLAAPHGSMQGAKRRFAYLALLPILASFAVFSVAPIVFSMAISLFNYNPIGSSPPFVGLGNFAEASRDPVFLKSMGNTFVFVLASVSINIVVATLVAYCIDLAAARGVKDAFRTVFFLPTTANIAAIAIVWGYMLDPDFGIVAGALDALGAGYKLHWFSDAKLVLPSIIVVNLWQDIGYNIVIVLAGLQSIPRTFYESAVMDGAGKRLIFFRVTLPLMSRTMLFVSIVTIISYFQVFTPVMAITRGGPDHASELMGVSIYLNAFFYGRLGYASAMAVILMAIMMVLSLAQMRVGKTDWQY